MALFDLTGRTVCVFGGGGYLAAPVCKERAMQGAHVVVVDLRQVAAECVAADIVMAGNSAEAVTLDVSEVRPVNWARPSLIAR